MERLNYLRMTLTNQDCINEEVNYRLNGGKACYQRCRIFCLPIYYLETYLLHGAESLLSS